MEYKYKAIVDNLYLLPQIYFTIILKVIRTKSLYIYTNSYTLRFTNIIEVSERN